MQMPTVRRGDVYHIYFGSRKGHEQEGLRSAIVVQADLYCELSILWVIPTSSSVRGDIDFHVPVTIQGQHTFALIEQLTTVDKERRIRANRYLDHLSQAEMEEIDRMMRIFAGLDPDLGVHF
ncbi:MAG: type II toxin-antitoxin system PemK/MazF family toxin [Candidatus Bipolaricaulia bacterium]